MHQTRPPPFTSFLPRLLAALAFTLSSAAALAQADPPARVARLSHSEGAVVFSHSGDREWVELSASRPVTRGDRLWTDDGARAELQLGATTVRLSGQTLLDIKQLDGQAADLGIARGSVSARLRSLGDGDSFEITTPNLAFKAGEPGNYRVDVDPVHGTTRVTVLSGAATAYGSSGQAVVLAGGQQASFREKDLTRVSSQEAPPLDNFDRWAEERSRREDQSVAARYVPRDITGYQQLDPHGQWSQDASLGPVWFPQVTPQWAPYRFGQWEWIAPWGWTWMDDAPWAFATSHYGRWARIDSRWAWVPGRLAAKPVYAPALVAFIGKGDSISAWFPLAPGEAWQPPYKASLAHTGGINRGALPVAGDQPPLAHQRRAEALTVISSGDFHRGKPAQASWLRVALNELSGVQLVPPPPMPQRLAAAAPTPPRPAAPIVVAAQPPPAPRPVQLAQAPAPKAPARPATPVAAAPKAAAPVAAAAPKAIPKAAPQPAVQQLAQRREQAAREQTARDQALRAQALRDKAQRLETARRAEQVQKAVLAKKAEQARRTEMARRDADARKMAAAQQEARARQLALVQSQAQAQKQAQARREEQARRVAQVRREEQARLEARNQWLSQARRSADREAQSLREQQAQRDDHAQRELLAQRESNDRERARREAQEREQARFDAWQRQQQAQSDKLRRDQQLWEQARERTRQPQQQDRRYLPPEWQRIPVVPSRVL